MSIGITSNRLQHCLGVARYMYNKSLEVTGSIEYAQKMFNLGYVHDIGYEFTDVKVDHPMVGGLLLRNSNYAYWREVYYHGDTSEAYSSIELDLLNEADLSVNSKGELVGVKARLQGLTERYGANSSQYIKSSVIAKRLNLI